MQLLSWDTKFKHCLDGFVKRLQQKAQEALSQGVIVDAFKGRRVVHLIGETRTESIVKLCSEIERNIFSENAWSTTKINSKMFRQYADEKSVSI